MKRPAVLLAVLLVAASASLITYRVVRLGYPLLPAATKKVWQLSMEGLVRPDKEEIAVSIAVPYTHGPQTVTEERFTPGGFSFNLVREGPSEIGVWSGKTGPAGEVIGYRATVLVRPTRSIRARSMEPGTYPASFEKGDQELARGLAARWSRLRPPERARAAAATISGTWGETPPNPKDLDAWSKLVTRDGRTAALLALLRAADLHARLAQGLILAEGVTSAPISWIEVWTGQQWIRILPETGLVYDPSVSFLALTTGGTPPVRVSRGAIPEVRWTLTPQILSQWRVYFNNITEQDRPLNRWSLFSLPPEFQGTFRILLLVPIGALMVCVLRNMIGFPTFGIFMPVLMALAFRSTGLTYGLAIFAGVIFAGYVIRLFLDRLHLLLVPRLSVILTVVIGCFTFLAVVGNKLGIRELMAVGLLPFVILTMMIERFFVITEEAGMRQGLESAAGSAAVAAITHLIIHIETLQFTFFVYPELLLVLVALQILIGRYTGYRLSELLRFRALRRE